jgi:hypothetical protein
MKINTFQETLVNISKCHNAEINSDTEDMIYMLIAPNRRKNIHFIAVKELQITLKIALKKTETLDVKNKLGIENFDEEKLQGSEVTAKTRNSEMYTKD